MAYTITNTAGTPVATIGVATTTGSTFPVELVGTGISPYGEIIAQDLYWMVENFANTSFPVNPIIGQFAYRTDVGIPYFRNSSSWVALSTARNSVGTGFTMLPAATSINLGATGLTTIFQGTGGSERFHPTGLMLLPNGAITATSPAALNLYIDSSEDIMENVLVSNMASNRHAYYSVEGTTRFVTGSETIKFEVTTAASGGTLRVDAYLFGFVSV